MKTVTEDQVVSLMEDLRARERDALRDLAKDVDAGRFAPQQTARLFRFEREGPRKVAPKARDGKVVSLAESRASLNARRTKRGFFVYATDAPQPA